MKGQWVAAVEVMATETYADWRALFQQSGRRLRWKREGKEPTSAWQPQRIAFIQGLLEWLHAKIDPNVVDEMGTRLAGMLELAIFGTREFLLGNYSVETNDSDVFDHFQRQYLAMNEFVIMTRDSKLLRRTQQSPQAPRIMSFDQFLRAL